MEAGLQAGMFWLASPLSCGRPVGSLLTEGMMGNFLFGESGLIKGKLNDKVDV